MLKKPAQNYRLIVLLTRVIMDMCSTLSQLRPKIVPIIANLILNAMILREFSMKTGLVVDAILNLCLLMPSEPNPVAVLFLVK
jgi:hypothetical protein